MTPCEHPRIQSHLSTDATGLTATFAEPEAGKLDTGQYEATVLVTLAKARRDSGEFDVDFVREGVKWLATRHATPDTHVMGEGWKVFTGTASGRSGPSSASPTSGNRSWST